MEKETKVEMDMVLTPKGALNFFIHDMRILMKIWFVLHISVILVVLFSGAIIGAIVLCIFLYFAFDYEWVNYKYTCLKEMVEDNMMDTLTTKLKEAINKMEEENGQSD